MLWKASLPMVIGLALAAQAASAAERNAPPGSIPAFAKTVKCGGAVNSDGSVASVGTGDLRFDTRRVSVGVYDVSFKPGKCGTNGSVAATAGYIRVVQPDLLGLASPINALPPSVCSVWDSPMGPNIVRVACYWWNNPAGNFAFRDTPFTILLMK